MEHNSHHPAQPSTDARRNLAPRSNTGVLHTPSLLEEHDCTYASLDHDLGDYAEVGGDGYRLVLWMAEHDRWPTHGIRIHSANHPSGMARMLADIDHYGPYPPGNGIKPGDGPSDGEGL